MPSHFSVQLAPGSGAVSAPVEASTDRDAGAAELAGACSVCSVFGGGANAFVGAGTETVAGRGVIPGAAIMSASSVGTFGASRSAT